MKFYMIQDLNSGLWYKIGSYEGVWIEQKEASVWTNMDEPHGVLAAMDNIEAYNAWRLRSQPCEPVIRIIDTEALEILRKLCGLEEQLTFANPTVIAQWNTTLTQARKLLK